MYCGQCGTANDDNAWKCLTCGHALQQTSASEVPPVQVPNYLVQAILCTVCCCPPLGIPAIVFAARVNHKAGAGDLVGAQDASRKAKLWCWIAFGVGLALNLLYYGFMVVAGLSSS